MLTVTGLTQDGKKVVSGVYMLYSSQGIPLDIIFSYMKDNDFIPDWIEFYQTALKEGMKKDRVISKLTAPINDVWGFEFGKVVLDTLNQLASSSNG